MIADLLIGNRTLSPPITKQQRPEPQPEQWAITVYSYTYKGECEPTVQRPYRFIIYLDDGGKILLSFVTWNRTVWHKSTDVSQNSTGFFMQLDEKMLQDNPKFRYIYTWLNNVTSPKRAVYSQFTAFLRYNQTARTLRLQEDKFLFSGHKWRSYLWYF